MVSFIRVPSQWRLPSLAFLPTSSSLRIIPPDLTPHKSSYLYWITSPFINFLINYVSSSHHFNIPIYIIYHTSHCLCPMQQSTHSPSIILLFLQFPMIYDSNGPNTITRTPLPNTRWDKCRWASRDVELYNSVLYNSIFWTCFSGEISAVKVLQNICVQEHFNLHDPLTGGCKRISLHTNSAGFLV